MKSIREAVGLDLQWRRVKWWKREFELQWGDEAIAKLFQQKYGSSAIGEASDGQWAFRRQSIWNADLVVTELTTETEIAVVKCGTKKRLAFSDGRLLTLRRNGPWRNEWIWLNEAETPLIRFQRNKHLTVEASSLWFPELSLLVILGWHLIVLHQDEEASASAYD